MRSSKSRATCFVLLLALLFVFPWQPARSQSEPFLNRFEGTWQGEGKTMGMTAHLQLKWEWVLGNKFLRLSLNNTMRAGNGRTQIFEGHAYYRSTGESKYDGKWFDSRGEAFPITAFAEGNALVSSWGTPEKEQGKSIYRLIESNKMEVVDSVRQKDGTWKEFGKFVVTRTLSHASARGSATVRANVSTTTRQRVGRFRILIRQRKSSKEPTRLYVKAMPVIHCLCQSLC